jgi:hypothetical protein
MVEPLDGGRRSRLTIALEFEGHGIGRLLVPLVVRRRARRQLPRNEQNLKEALERWANCRETRLGRRISPGSRIPNRP